MLYSAAIFLLACGLASGTPQTSTSPPTCTDGGILHCCQATISGAASPVLALSAFGCYDLTPAVVNCVIADAPTNTEFGCAGSYSCCQVNDLVPVIGLFCSKPPGDCRGDEGNGRCTDVVNGRFGNCSSGDVAQMRKELGL